MTKKELRAAMRRRNLGMDAAERAEASRRIFGRAGRLDTAETLARWSAVKRIVVPRVEGDVMRFCEYDPQTLRPGAFGIAEPGPEAQTCDPSEIDLVIVPGTAFTAAGARCGRGRGYYDKYLARPDVHAVKVGVCFAHQLVGELPAEPHDVAMDYIITD